MEGRLHIYLDESGGVGEKWLIMAGVVFKSDHRRDAAEQDWLRSRRKGRKWTDDQFCELVKFAEERDAFLTGCHTRVTEEVLEALGERMQAARDLEVHSAHGASTPLKAYSYLWGQLAAHFLGTVIGVVVDHDVLATAMRIYPDRTSMPPWQKEILRSAFARLDGNRMARNLQQARGSIPAVDLDRIVSSCKWSAPEFRPDAQTSRLLDLADGYCALYALCLKDPDRASRILERLELSLDDLLSDRTDRVLWRARLGWEESAETFGYPPEIDGESSPS